MTDPKNRDTDPDGNPPETAGTAETPDRPGETGSAAEPAADAAEERRPSPWTARRISIAVLAVLGVLAVSYISWPLWDDALPRWLRAGLAPVMDAGRGGGATDRVDALAGRLDRVEAGLAALRKDFAAMPRPGSGAAAEAERVTALENSFAELRADVVEKAGSTELARLAARFDALEKRLAAAATDGGAPEAASAIAALREQSAARMAGLEKENDALRKRLAGLEQRLSALADKAAAAGPEKANALLLAVGQLREATRGTTGFAEALDAVAALAEGDAAVTGAVAKLKPHSGGGVADLITLRARFEPVADAIARAASAPPGDGWIDRTVARITNLVTIRKVGESAAARDDVQGLIARAELRLAAGDLAGAVEALGRLEGAPAKAAAAWLSAARARLAVDGAVAQLFGHALGKVSAGPRG